MTAPIILWLRRNLRVTDNAALLSASQLSAPVIPIYIIDELDAGGASRWWLHHSLERLSAELSTLGAPLIVRSGDPVTELASLSEIVGAAAIHYCRRYEPLARGQESRLRSALAGSLRLRAFDDHVLRGPDEVHTLSGSPYKVFTPFWKTSVGLGDPAAPTAAPRQLTPYDGPIPSIAAANRALLPTAPDWSGGLAGTWTPGEDAAHTRVDDFTDWSRRYHDSRDRPDRDETSRLSPHLHFGEISPRQVWHHLMHSEAGQSDGAAAFLRQLYWRDFSAYLLYHFPALPNAPLRSEFAMFPWTNDKEFLDCWQRGQTGYPIIDAGMRQLWSTGWMHNRVRMIVASFLVKNLMVDWRRGADWFNDTLVDADLANNSASWQWVAGCGTDAAPYFRIFNPVLQGKKFDPNGRYVRRWVPEIASLGTDKIHEPWRSDQALDYPPPIVDLKSSRAAALEAYQSQRSLLQSPAVSPGSSVG